MEKKIAFPLLFNQTYQFISSKIWQIILVSVIVGIFFSLISDLFLAYLLGEETINDQMSGNVTLLDIFNTMLSNMIKIIFVFMIINLINLSFNISAVYKLSSSDKLNINSLVSKTTSSVLKLFGFTFIYLSIFFFVAIVFALFFLILLQIFSGKIIAGLMIICILALACYFQIILYSFIGSITGPTSKTFFQIFIEIHRLIKQYWLAGFLIVLINYTCIFCLGLLLKDVPYSNYILSPIANFTNIFLIYFFYQISILLSKEQSVSENSDATNNKLLV